MGGTLKTKALALIPGAAVLALTLAACGAGATGSTRKPTAAAATTSAAAVTDANGATSAYHAMS